MRWAHAVSGDPAIQKLYGRWGSTPQDYFLGSPRALAATPTWIVAGSNSADEGETNAGAAQVFNAAKGGLGAQTLAAGPLSKSQVR